MEIGYAICFAAAVGLLIAYLLMVRNKTLKEQDSLSIKRRASARRFFSARCFGRDMRERDLIFEPKLFIL